MSRSTISTFQLFAISELRAAGFDAEWHDDYEPQENRRTRVTIFAIPREKCED